FAPFSSSRITNWPQSYSLRKSKSNTRELAKHFTVDVASIAEDSLRFTEESNMNSRRVASVLIGIASCAFFFAGPMSFAAPSPADSPSGILTPQQALNLRRIADLHFSPDGSRLAFTIVEPPKGTENASHIWLLDVSTK